MLEGKDDVLLVQRFVEKFPLVDRHAYTPANPPRDEFFGGIDKDDWNTILWKPASWNGGHRHLSPIRRIGSLPSLYEYLALNFRWPEVDLGICRLLPNEPGEDLQPLADCMFKDPIMKQILLPACLVRFAVSMDYDPICFDCNHMQKSDCPVVRVEHESILVHGRIGQRTTLFGSVRELMLAVINAAV